jgi:hypothetical protein
MRHERESAAACAKSQREAANVLVARMARMYGGGGGGGGGGDDGDDGGGDDDATDSDEEDLAKELEAALLDEQGAGRAAAAAAAHAAAEAAAAHDAEEAAARADLRAMLFDGAGGAAGGGAGGAGAGGANAGKKLQLRRVLKVIHPGGRIETIKTLITDKAVIDAYLSAKAGGRDTTAAVLAAQGPAGHLPYPLQGTRPPPPAAGRAMKPELEARRAKEAVKREERKAKQAAEQYEKLRGGLTATAMQAGTTGPGGLAVAGEGVKLKFNLNAAKQIASKLLPEKPKKPWSTQRVKKEKPPADDDDDEEEDDDGEFDDASDEDEDDADSDSGGGGGGKKRKRKAAKAGKREREREKERERVTPAAK